jgi:signal transduction histidine kinase
VADIMAGDLSRRIPADGAGDDFSQLVDNLNRMLERIESLLEGVRQVSDNIAHDLRTPLARLRNRLDELQKETGRGRAGTELVEQAIREADGLLATFGALLRIARIEAGARRSGFVPVDLAALARDVVELYEPVAEESGRSLRLEALASPVVQGDPELLSQALANLVDNALKYGADGAPVDVQVAEIDGAPCLTVSDAGPGIPEGERTAVFRRFHRLDSSRASPGSGLGLSLVAAVAGLHRVDVRLGDAGPGLRAELRWPKGGRARPGTG